MESRWDVTERKELEGTYGDLPVQLPLLWFYPLPVILSLHATEKSLVPSLDSCPLDIAPQGTAGHKGALLARGQRGFQVFRMSCVSGVVSISCIFTFSLIASS